MKRRRREIIHYLLFVLLAAVFWVFQAANEIYEQELEVPLEIANVPSNVVITSELPSSVRVKVKNKGIALFPYVYGRQSLPKLVVDFNEYRHTNGHVRILTSEIVEPVIAARNFTFLGVSPDTLEFYYNYGESKRVPVRWQGDIQPQDGYSVGDIALSSDSVMVYASREVLDTITAAWLQPTTVAGVADTTTLTRSIQKVRGARFSPSSVKVTFFTDRIVEKSVEVPVQGVNFPAGKKLQTFPAQVSITFQVGMKRYREVTAEDFILVVNYEDLLQTEGNRCHLSLKSTPLGTSQVKIDPNDVEFIIEDSKEPQE